MAAKKTVAVKTKKPAQTVSKPKEPEAAPAIDMKAIAAKYTAMSAHDICEIAKRGAQPGRSEAEWEALVRMADDFKRLAEATA
jgi:hypothetical protein